jgi:outer membrane protein W
MKKKLIVLLILVLIIPVRSVAQSFAVDKGSLLIDGSITFSSAGGDLNEENGKKLTSMTFNPTLGYFFIPNLGTALEGLYASESQGDSKTTVIGIGPKVAYYFGNAESKQFPFIGVGILYVKSNNHIKQSQVNINLAVGTTMMVAKNVGITGKIFYTRENYKPEDADESIKGYTIGLGVGVSTFIF